jgi:hypothetical protein
MLVEEFDSVGDEANPRDAGAERDVVRDALDARARRERDGLFGA